MHITLNDLRERWGHWHFPLAEEHANFDGTDGTFITVTVREMAITNPYQSECGRFEVDPMKEYGIPSALALEIVQANRERITNATRARKGRDKKFDPSSESHIERHRVEHGGGSVYNDVLELRDGKVLLIAADDIILYPSRQAMEDDSEDPWAFPRIGRHGYGG